MKKQRQIKTLEDDIKDIDEKEKGTVQSVRGLFQPLIPLEARERPEVRTQTAVMVPDFCLELSASTPGLNLLPQESVSRLAELKFTCSKTLQTWGEAAPVQESCGKTVGRDSEGVPKESG